MADTAVGLSEVPELAGLKLGRWARTLGFRGHVSSKSRRYSTTLGALRAVRSDYARARHRDREGVDPAHATGGEGVEVASSWRMVGRGYTPAQSLLAQSIAVQVEGNREAAREGLADLAVVERDQEWALPDDPSPGARPRAGGWAQGRRAGVRT
jgi:hypothetical protein